MEYSRIFISLFLFFTFIINTSAQLEFNYLKSENIETFKVSTLNDSILQTKLVFKGSIENISLLNNELECFNIDSNNLNYITTFFKNPIKSFLSSDIRKPRILQLSVKNNDNQNVHPDVLYIPQGFGPFKYKYWITFTPYPDSKIKYENPCIYAGYDGLNWEIPFGLTNPIVSEPTGLNDHNADTDLTINSDSTELWLYYEQGSSLPLPVYLFRIKSLDGVNWSSPDTILKSSVSLFISPSIVYDKTDKKYYLWTNNYDIKSNNNNNNNWEIRESKDGRYWSTPKYCTVKYNNITGRVWHHDVRKNKDFYEALITMASDRNNLYYAKSFDKINWTAFLIMTPFYDFEKGHLYRSTFLPVDSIPNFYHIWYSAYSGKETNKWKIAEVFAKIGTNKIEYFDMEFKKFPNNAYFQQIEISGIDNTKLFLPIEYSTFSQNSSPNKKMALLKPDSSSFSNSSEEISLITNYNNNLFFKVSNNYNIVHIYIYDIQGKKLFEENTTVNDGYINLSISKILKDRLLIIKIQAESLTNKKMSQKTFKIFTN